MAARKRRLVHIVSHGPACLDGAAAAAVVARFYRKQKVVALFAANSDSDLTLQSLTASGKGHEQHEIWITDLSWTSTETGAHLRRLSQSGTRLYWVDHHRTAVSRADSDEFQVPFAGKVLSEECAASRLVFDFIRKNGDEIDPDGDLASLENFAPIVALADDHDRWIHQIKDSPDWALVVQTLGARDSFNELVRLKAPRMSRVMAQALEIGKRAVRQSIELARSTAVEQPLPMGVKLCTAFCFGYNSEAAAELYKGRSNTVVALLDLRSLGISLRRSADSETDLSKIAEAFGGGGHAAAAGFELAELTAVAGSNLSEVLGRKIANVVQSLGLR